jgi:flagellar FliL protein
MAEATADNAAPNKDEAATPEEKPKKSKKMLFIIIGVAVVLIGGGAAAAFVFLGGGDEQVTEEAEGAAPAETADGGLVTMDTFLVNLNDSSGERYMKLTLRLTVTPESAAEEIEANDLMVARLRDRVLTVLTSKTFEEVGDPMGKESLRQQIQAQLNLLLGDKGKVQEVLFSEFVVQ